MRLSSGTHLTYCTNIHPGETWPEVAVSLRKHLPDIKARVCAEAPLGLGLRLSAAAARELETDAAFEDLCELLEACGAYVFTLNGFPYGQFHGERIKERVYQPDWRSQERIDYTLSLARLLSRLERQRKTGCDTLSISTVPGCYRYARDETTAQEVARSLAQVALFLAKLERETGAHVVLGLEPEPACLMETTQEAVNFFKDHLLSQKAREGLGVREVQGSRLEELLVRYLGICLDTCHAAVQYEDPAQTVRLLRSSGLRVAKVQVTTGLEVPCATRSALSQLSKFDDGQYLHQGSIKGDDAVLHFVDLPEALENTDFRDRPWRVHFHVPVFMKTLGHFQNTQEDLKVILDEHNRAPLSEHLEVETYTFFVLPDEYRTASVSDAICRELEWTRAQLQK